MDQFDVVVVGSGAIALSVACWLHRLAPECSVARVGPTRDSGNASRAAGAMLGNYGEVSTAGMPHPALSAKLRMGNEATALWPEWLDGLAQHVEPALAPAIRRGTYIILNPRSGQLDDLNYAAIRSTLVHNAEPFEDVDPREIASLRPVESQRPLRALYLPKEGSVDSARVLNALDAALAHAPTHRQVDALATRLECDGNGRNRVRLSSGKTLHAKEVVLAGGASSQALIDTIPELAARVPRLFSGVGCSLLLENKAGFSAVIRTPNRAFACGLHTVTRDDGTLYLGATNRIQIDPQFQPSVSDVAYLLQGASEQLNQRLRAAHILDIRVGNRPVTVDTFPLIGPTQCAGIHLATGTYRSGFHLAPVIGKQVACAVLKRTDDPPLSFFLPERPPISTFTRDQAIELATHHALAYAFERGFGPPVSQNWQEQFEAMTRDRVHKAYHSLEADFVPPPDFLDLIEAGGLKARA
jgi:glycine/D-amino acid oxidase-like deaminating enzyme